MHKTMVIALLAIVAALLLSGCIVVGDHNATGIGNKTGQHTSTAVQPAAEEQGGIEKFVAENAVIVMAIIVIIALFAFGSIEVVPS